MLIEEQNPLKEVEVVHLNGLQRALKLVTLPILEVVVTAYEAHHQGNLVVFNLLLFLFFVFFLLYPKKLFELFEAV
jgi:hypothetical protein